MIEYLHPLIATGLELPTILAIISASAAVVGTGVGTYAAVKQGDAAEEASKRAQEAENANAQAEQNAAALEAGQVRRRNLLRFGSQRAAAAKSGVLIEGAQDVIYDTSVQGELEALSTLYGGASAASYYRSRGANARAEGSAARSASRIQAGSTLIGGIGRTAEAYGKIPKRADTRSALYLERGPQ